MAQNFRREVVRAVGTSPATVYTSNSYDTLVGVHMANTTSSDVTVSVYITVSGNDFYLIKNAPLPSGGALQLMDGGAKIVTSSGDTLKVVSNTASSVDVWVSYVDSIST